MKVTKETHEQAITRLKELLPPGATVYTSVRHVSRSGMSRSISCYAMVDNQPIWIDSLVSKATGLTFDSKREAIKISGCGMDMGFAIVYELGYSLYKNGFGCIGEGCPSNDHSNGDKDYTPHYDGTPRNSKEVGKDLKPYRHYHKDGGYTMRQRWL